MRRVGAPLVSVPTLFVADVDDILSGCEDALLRIAAWLAKDSGLVYAVASARSSAECLSLLKAAGAPLPDFVIGGMGSEICQVQNGVLGDQWSAWAKLHETWNRDFCLNALRSVSGLTLLPSAQRGRRNLSYHVATAQVADAATRCLRQSGILAWAFLARDHHLEITPPNGGKGGAAAFVAEALGIPAARIISAGGSGFDLDVLAMSARAIATGNAEISLRLLTGSPNVYFATRGNALGIWEGLEHWRSWLEQPASSIAPLLERRKVRQGC